MMRRVAQQVSWIEELVQYFESKKAGQKIWFTRKMNKLSPEQQDEVWTVLTSRGHTKKLDKTKPVLQEEIAEVAEVAEETRTFISWTEAEWDQIADTVWRARKNDPSETLVGLTRKVMDILPKERRRNIRTANELKQLVERLRVRDETLLMNSDDLEFYKLQIYEFEAKQQQIPSREQIISDLTDEEILLRFGEKVLQNCSPQEVISRYPTDALLSTVPAVEAVGYFLKLGIEMFADSQKQLVGAIQELTATVRHQNERSVTGSAGKPSIPMPKPKTRLPKVTVVGLLANQQAKVQEGLEGRAVFNFLDKNRKPDASAIPDGQDIVVLAANFITHSMQEAAKKKIKGTDTRLIVHHGGLETMIRKLDEILPGSLVLA